MEIVINEDNDNVQFWVDKEDLYARQVYNALFNVLNQFYGKIGHLWIHQYYHLNVEDNCISIEFNTMDHDFMNCVGIQQKQFNYNLVDMVRSVYKRHDSVHYALLNWGLEENVKGEFKDMLEFIENNTPANIEET